MIRRVQAHSGAEEHAVADGDACHVKENAIHVGIEILADERVASIIAVEWGFHESTLSKCAEQFVKQFVTFFERVIFGRVDGLHQATLAHIRFLLLRTIGHIQFAGEHTLPFVACRMIGGFHHAASSAVLRQSIDVTYHVPFNGIIIR